jgi:VIT1/CCC1 family predicted Fe2+/Mn2+ transporter
MSNEEQERLRAQRIREGQIKARDPGPSKIRHYDWSKHKKPPKKQEPLLVETWHLLPSRFRGVAIGVLVGLVFAVILKLVLPANLALLAILPILICGMMGWVLGKLLE